MAFRSQDLGSICVLGFECHRPRTSQPASELCHLPISGCSFFQWKHSFLKGRGRLRGTTTFTKLLKPLFLVLKAISNYCRTGRALAWYLCIRYHEKNNVCKEWFKLQCLERLECCNSRTWVQFFLGSLLPS